MPARLSPAETLLADAFGQAMKSSLSGADFVRRAQQACDEQTRARRGAARAARPADLAAQVAAAAKDALFAEKRSQGTFLALTDWLVDLTRDSASWKPAARATARRALASVVCHGAGRGDPGLAQWFAASPAWTDWLARSPAAVAEALWACWGSISWESDPRHVECEREWLLLSHAASGLRADLPASDSRAENLFGPGLHEDAETFLDARPEFSLALASSGDFDNRKSANLQMEGASPAAPLHDGPQAPWRHERLADEMWEGIPAAERPRALREGFVAAAGGGNAHALEWCLRRGVAGQPRALEAAMERAATNSAFCSIQRLAREPIDWGQCWALAHALVQGQLRAAHLLLELGAPVDRPATALSREEPFRWEPLAGAIFTNFGMSRNLGFDDVALLWMKKLLALGASELGVDGRGAPLAAALENVSPDCFLHLRRLDALRPRDWKAVRLAAGWAPAGKKPSDSPARSWPPSVRLAQVGEELFAQFEADQLAKATKRLTKKASAPKSAPDARSNQPLSPIARRAPRRM